MTLDQYIQKLDYISAVLALSGHPGYNMVNSARMRLISLKRSGTKDEITQACKEYKHYLLEYAYVLPLQ